MIRVVLDTNVLVSAFRTPQGNEAAAERCVRDGRADYLVTSNRRHFPETRYGTAEVVNARELLGRLRPA